MNKKKIAMEQQRVDSSNKKTIEGKSQNYNSLGIRYLLNEVKNYLNDGGIVQLIQSSLCDNDKTLDILDKQGFVAEIAVSEHFFFEDVVLINGYL